MAVITGAAIVAAGAVGAAAISSNASKNAAKTAADAQREGLSASQAGVGRARGDINRLFGGAEEARAGGFGQALDFLGGSVGRQVDPFQRGNVLAQQQISRGLPQIQSAILGQPTNLSGFQARQIGQPSDFNIPIPRQPDPVLQSGLPVTNPNRSRPFNFPNIGGNQRFDDFLIRENQR